MKEPACSFALPVLGLALLALSLACIPPHRPAGEASRGQEPLDLRQADYARAQLAKYARHEMAVDLSSLDERERAALDELVAAAREIDELFLEQVWEGNRALRDRLAASRDPAAEPLREFFRINYGPFDRLEHQRPFIGDRPKPPGAAFYPEEMTREEFQSWVDAHPEQRAALEGTFTVVRREAGRLRAIPYSEFYAEGLTRLAGHLRRAAGLTDNPSLKAFLESRAAAFLSNDYYASDMAWMDVRGNRIDVTIGPYEVYEDGIFNYKAAFEAFVCLRDPAESARLETIKELLPAMEENLPIPDEYKNKRRGTESPVSVADLVVSAGDTRAGVQTIAFNLPNDERVREAKGSKKVLLKNVMRAKYERIYVPIAREVLLPGLAERADFESFFHHTLLHEISHGLGPGTIVVGGRETTAAKELKELHSAIEEAKADTLGVYNTQFLADRGRLEAERAERAYVAFLGGIFRSVRFGIGEAHGKANMLILNYLLEQGGYFLDRESGRFGVNPPKAREGFRRLAAELLTLEAQGDYAGAARFVERYGNMPPEVEAVLSRLGGIPVDIDPHYAVDR